MARTRTTLLRTFGLSLLFFSFTATTAFAQEDEDTESTNPSNLYDYPMRWLVNMPTAGTLHRANYEIGVGLFTGGGAIGHTDIGLSNHLQLGISFGGEGIITNTNPNWNPRIEFNVKFRAIEEEEYFPAVTVGFNSQGNGAFNPDLKRYTLKSRGFYAVVSRSFYFYEWTAGWHGGINYSLENRVDEQRDVNFFVGLDAAFKYNLAMLLEWDAALNDDASQLPSGQNYAFSGRGRGYMSLGVRWLYNDNLELEARLIDLFQNRRESNTFGREIRITYIGAF